MASMQPREGAAWQEQVVPHLKGIEADVAVACPLELHLHGVHGLGEIQHLPQLQASQPS